MIRLYRKILKAPKGWRQKVDGKLANAPAFHEKAREFERLGVNEEPRRQGFTKVKGNGLPAKNGRPYFPSLWGDAKDQLAVMSHDKCAYCEGELNARRVQQVEHFKPKSLFPTLAYDWDNYFLACGGCNGAKLDQWPEAGEYLRPDTGNPSKALRFESDGSVTAIRAAGAAAVTVKHFDLNRKPLIRRRTVHLKKMLRRLERYVRLYQKDRALGREFAQDELKDLKDPEAIYSAALTQCFLREWNTACPGARL